MNLNSFYSLIKKIKLWGIKGIFDYLLRLFINRKKRKFFLLNASSHPMTPSKGITIIADMTKKSALSKTMRDLAFALQKSNIPFQTFDLSPSKGVPPDDIKNILTPVKDFRILKYTHVIEMFSSPLPDSIPLKKSCILFWEFTTGLLEYFPAIKNAKNIIAMSDFDYNVFKDTLPKSTEVRKILYPFFLNDKNIPEKHLLKDKYAIPHDAFTIFFNFDYGSSFNRKNPDGAVRAFAKAFPYEKNTCLVFKTKGSENHYKEKLSLLQLCNELGVADRVIMIDEFIPIDDVYGLTSACDVYLSLHRGEGFGLGIAEAMSLGKPVIVTDFSATTEFCNHKNSFPVPYSIVNVPDGIHDNPCYHAVREWAEPDIDYASEVLRKLYADKSLCENIGNAAKSFIEEHFSPESFRQSIEDYLQ